MSKLTVPRRLGCQRANGPGGYDPRAREALAAPVGFCDPLYTIETCLCQGPTWKSTNDEVRMTNAGRRGGQGDGESAIRNADLL